MTSHRIPIHQSHSANLRHLGFLLVPTILLVDSEGKVNHLWVGALSSHEEASILDIIRNAPHVTANARDECPPVVSEENFTRFLKENPGEVLTLDVRERETFAGNPGRNTLNIPLDELELRAPNELDPSKIIAIDCSAIPYAVCTLMARRLAGSGFERVTIVEGEAAILPCTTCPAE